MSYLRKQPDVWTTTKPDTKKDIGMSFSLPLFLFISLSTYTVLLVFQSWSCYAWIRTTRSQIHHTNKWNTLTYLYLFIRATIVSTNTWHTNYIIEQVHFASKIHDFNFQLYKSAYSFYSTLLNFELKYILIKYMYMYKIHVHVKLTRNILSMKYMHLSFIIV